MLESLSGRTHEVVSGLALITAMWEEVRHETTYVTFRGLTPRDIARYVPSGEWEGRAGGYAIQGQGAALVERIEGDYFNVVGLPAALLVRLLAERTRHVRVRMSGGAVAAAVAVAAEHRLRGDDPVVLRATPARARPFAAAAARRAYLERAAACEGGARGAR